MLLTSTNPPALSWIPCSNLGMAPINHNFNPGKRAMLKDIHTNLPGGNTHLKCWCDHIVTANNLTHKPLKTVPDFQHSYCKIFYKFTSHTLNNSNNSKWCPSQFESKAAVNFPEKCFLKKTTIHKTDQGLYWCVLTLMQFQFYLRYFSRSANSQTITETRFQK